MRLDEVIDDGSDKLAAIGQFLLKRAEDTAAKKKISVDAFIQLANQNGINLTADRLNTLIQKDPLKNIIANIEGNDIIFQGQDQVSNTMSVDQARKTVDSMAKRALNR
jgi:hypothetical protein